MDISAINAWLLERLQVYLNDHARHITLADLRALTDDCGIDDKEAFSLLLASAFGLDMADNPLHRQIYSLYFPPMIRCLDPEVYHADPYYRNIRVPRRALGRWELGRGRYAPCEGFVCGDMRRLPDGRLIPPIGFFTQAFAYPCVKEDGREWMLITPNEMETIRPVVDAARGKVLAFGLGLGYFAYMAARKGEVASVDIVERDPDVVRLFADHILPQFPAPEKVRLIQADAFAYMQNSAPAERYDLIFTDLWHDASDGVPLYRRMKALEPLSPASRFAYWIEPTLRCYMDA